MPPPGVEQLLLAFPGPVASLGTALRVRSTLLVSSMQSLRKRDRVDDYLAHLPQEHHPTVLSMIAGQWVPMPLALAHYDACDALGLAEAEIHLIGREVGDRVEGTFLSHMVRMAGRVGATPWTAMMQSGRLFDRLLEGGGGVSVTRLGPKDARVHFVGLPLARVPYFRRAMAGVFEVGAELFCERAYAHEVAKRTTPTSITVDISWA